ncbi:hypothetical protein CDAR_456271 [Caerostris darwini]|uniref:Uncharacterized protein n=1 Tax=Caerostris darwini TaxID=1538125 RepID=A0AAV4QDN3_9ARAC|nr:hypothetical protein CDAR_456271 [Caerostris darwini]
MRSAAVMLPLESPFFQVWNATDKRAEFPDRELRIFRVLPRCQTKLSAMPGILGGTGRFWPQPHCSFQILLSSEKKTGFNNYLTFQS